MQDGDQGTINTGKADHHLDLLTVGSAVGIGLGLYVFVMGLVVMISGRGHGVVAVLSSWYVGFSPTIAGSLIGAVWGFADGFLLGIIVALIYNKVRKARK